MTVPTDNPAVQDFAAATNADFTQQCLIQDQNRDAIDLTGATLTMTLKEDLGGAAILTLTSGVVTANGSSIIITSATEGAFDLTIDKADFAALSFAGRAAISAFYDIVFTKAGSDTIRLARGQFSVSKGVS
jgi:hypothetical protein